MAFRVGQKVVCVDAKYDRIISAVIGWMTGQKWPVKDREYTVVRCGFTIVDGIIGVELAEIKNFEFLYRGYRATRFRPIVEKTTDISVFTEILDRETIKDDKPIRKPVKVK